MTFTEQTSGCGCGCGMPSRESLVPLSQLRHDAPATQAGGRHAIEQAHVPAGSFIMGDASGDRNPADGELPQHDVTLEAFDIDATAVSNADFAVFVDATGYVTEAEQFGVSAVFHLALTADDSDILGVPPATPWWYGVRGAQWRYPGGGTARCDPDHPVVHVTWNDAQAYCAWAGRRLPTEAEWEYASRGGLDQRRFPWGDEPVDAPRWRANIFQGTFPADNTAEDGFVTTAPVRSFEPNGYGLWQTIGNVWEWCEDWFNARTYQHSPHQDPRGPSRGQTRVLRGGSYLCHDSYCNRYRNAARSQNTPDSSMGNAGFRTVSLRPPANT